LAVGRQAQPAARRHPLGEAQLGGDPSLALMTGPGDGAGKIQLVVTADRGGWVGPG